MSAEHNYKKDDKNERALLIALVLTSTFLIIEAVGGFITGSLALISDAGHMLTDVTGLAIALVAIKIGRRPSDMRRTFGYSRFEILAAVANTVLLFCVALYILFEAYQRLKTPPEINTIGMLVIAIAGLIVNLIAMKILNNQKEQSLNVKGAYLEVWSDMLSSIGVIGSAIIIYFTSWVWVDSIVAILIGIWILPRVWTLLKASINVLLEGVPEGIELIQLRESILKIDGIKDVHELHIWEITTNKVSLTAHLIIDQDKDCEKLLEQVKEHIKSEYGITHITLQHETIKCLENDIF